ncbi:hypothetical protein DOY81_000879 [Sarcophaga bullata]|nr:hypothetical protein DOY81_000879 [Sarcophaga bullata]
MKNSYVVGSQYNRSSGCSNLSHDNNNNFFYEILLHSFVAKDL